MKKQSSLAKNTAILAIGNFSSKILTLILVPLYTACLSTAEYGSYDIIYSTMSLLIPILTLNIADAMLRFPMEKNADIPKICHIGLLFTLAGSVLVSLFSWIPIPLFKDIGGIQYAGPMFLVNALYQLLVLLARGTNRFILIAISGIISSASIVVLAILLLVVFEWGLDGIFLSNIVGMGAACFFLMVMFRRELFGRSTLTKGLTIRMVRYSFPLCLTLVGWWFINTVGRYIVLGACGIEANGLYSVSGKIPSILTVVTSIFLQAWQVSGIEEMSDNGNKHYIESVFNNTEMAIVVLCSAFIALTPLLSFFMFQDAFYSAWVYVPLQLVFVVFNTMGGMWGPIFSARFDTKPMAVSTLLGGVISLVLGVIFAHFAGVHGVIAASLIGVFVNWLWRGKKAEQYSQIDFHLKTSICIYLILIVQGILLITIRSGVLSLLIQMVIVLFFCIRYREALKVLVSTVGSKIRKDGSLG